MTDTVRLTCLKYLQTQLQAIQAGENNYLLTFSGVELGPITAPEAGRKRAMAGIVPGHELKRPEFPLTYCMLPVAIEFRVTWNQGDPPSQALAELVMGDIQRKVLEDITLGGNCVDCKEMGNEIQLTIYSDKSIMGVVWFDLLYRHNTSDPTKPV